MPSIASRESLRGGDHPSGKACFRVFWCADHWVGVGSLTAFFGSRLDMVVDESSSASISSSDSRSEIGALPLMFHLLPNSPETLE